MPAALCDWCRLPILGDEFFVCQDGCFHLEQGNPEQTYCSKSCRTADHS